MPYTTEMAFNKATEVQTLLAASKLRLFQSTLTPNAQTPKADFVANEADYDGYTAGGVAITAFLGPIADPAGGASIVSPLTLFSYVDDTGHVGNMIGGWFLETATGEVWAYGVYPQAIALAADGDAIPQVVSLVEGQNAIA